MGEGECQLQNFDRNQLKNILKKLSVIYKVINLFLFSKLQLIIMKNRLQYGNDGDRRFSEQTSSKYQSKMKTYLKQFFSHRKKNSISLMIIMIITQAQGQSLPGAIECKQIGFFLETSSNQCTICPSGYACPSTSSKIACSGGTYSLGGQITCTSCPSGYVCPNVNSPPEICLQGTTPSVDQLTCEPCPKGKTCANPESLSPGTCAVPSFQPSTGQSECLPCPSGQICTSDASTSCQTGFSSTLGSGSCQTSVAGEFVPNQYMAIGSCPVGTYQNLGSKSTCNICDAGSSCSSQSGTPTTCLVGQFSALGSTKCQTCESGYVCNDKTQASQTPCLDGYYLDTTVNPKVCKICPNGFQCSENAILTAAQITAQGLICPKGYAQTGRGCLYIGNRQSVTLGTNGQTTVTNCGSNQYIPSFGGSCAPCPSDYQCNLTPCAAGSADTDACSPCPVGLANCTQATIPLPSPRKCAPGFYRSNQHNCLICPEGKYCTAGAQPVACPAKTYSGKGMTACLPCPAGYDCSTSQTSSGISRCPSGYFSNIGQGTCTQCLPGQTCPYKDSPLEECIPGTFNSLNSNSLNCKLCPENQVCATKALSTATQCKTTEFAFIGSTACTTCPVQGQCVIDRLGVAQDCRMGQFYDTAKKLCVDCPAGFQCNANIKTVCPKGTKYDKDFAKCVECDDVHICVYDSATGADQSPNRWCYGKDPALKTVLDAFVNANRLPASHYQWCIDCNHPSLLNSICTFSTNYFVSQNGANITCPAKRSATQKVTIAGTSYQDKRFKDAYESYIYPYCKANVDMYWPQFASQQLNMDTECLPIVEYFDNRYIKTCQQTFPGFFSKPLTTTYKYQTPTDEILSQIYSIIEQRDFGTKTILKQCPEGQEFVTKGAGSHEQACQIKKAGDCKDSKSDFCHDGTDFKCLRGFTQSSDATITKRTKNKCSQPCPIGKTCSPDDTPTIKTCPAGRYCFDASEHPDQLVSRPGRNVKSVLDSSTGAVIDYQDIDCTQGICPPGQSDDTNYCPAGFRLDVSMNAHNAFNCHPNSAKKFTQITMNGAGNNPTIVNTPCTDGFYCPEAVRSEREMIPCEPGTYSTYNSASTGEGPQSKTQCDICPEGKFCPQGSKTSSVQNCKGGFFCPNNTRHEQEYPCPGGSYSGDGNNFKSSEQCTVCPSGSFCKEGSNSPVTCPKNSFCPANSTLFIDCPMDSYTTSTGGISVSSCTSCPTNYMCPGNTDPIACPAGTSGSWNPYNSPTDPGSMLCKPVIEGRFSSLTATSQSSCPDGKYSSLYAKECFDCPEGSYCIGGSKTECPAGKWCPQGTSSPQNCPSGKICNSINQDRQLFCPSGSYCPVSTGPNSAISTPINFFNVQGEITGIVNQCGNGYLCQGGSTGPYDSPCPANTLAGTGETICKPCTPGKWCPIGSGIELECPLGFYCNGIDLQPIQCPKGTYGAAKNLAKVEDCTKCPPGKTCSQNGLIAPDGDCDPGFYCKGGAWTPRPDENDPAQAATGGTCLIGGYCPKGSGTTTSCDPGTYNSFPGTRDKDECVPCTPGYYCAGSQNPYPTGKCQAGYFCTGGSSTPTQFSASPGHYSLEGSSMQIQCEAGTFSDSPNAAACKPCESGKYCPYIGMSDGLPCPKGYYCPSGSINESPCTIGTYNPDISSAGANACRDCDAGKYCDQEGLEIVSGDCEAGFYCNRASPNQYPYVTFTGLANPSLWSAISYPYGVCPTGYYCPLGTSNPNACPIGYYLNFEGADEISDCIKCNPGYYCNVEGLTSPVGKCTAGYYCPEASTLPTQSICPPGSFCVVGSASPKLCAAGTFQSQAGMSSCIACAAGFYCETGAVSQQNCPQGSYCLASSELPTPCSTSVSGLYNPLPNQISSAACIVCPKDKFCKIAGANVFDQIGLGDILDGYTSMTGSRYSIPPTGGSITSYCPRGSTCLAGTATLCPSGQYCEDFMLTAPSGPCQQGYFCTSGSISQTPSIIGQGGRCPISQYCEAGSTTGKECPVGTYSNGLGLFVSADCNKCPDGYVCDSLKTTDSTIKKCPAGYYCPSGISSISAAIICPAGNFCSEQSAAPSPCPPGQYQDQLGQTSCKTCLIGSYCPYTATSGTIPADGFIVNAPSMVGPAACPPGQYKPSGNHIGCADCPPGYFCDEYGIQGPLGSDKKCPGGYYCPGKTSDYSQFMCNPGFYCPIGIDAQIICPAGQYCDEYRLEEPKGPCEAGYFCIKGATVPNPDDGNPTGRQCDKGYYCELGTTSPKPCPIGKYNDKQGASSSSFCLNCPSNKICNTEGLGDPNSQCDGGVYCETINGIQTKTECEPGFRCPPNEVTKFKCLPGTYQSQPKQTNCTICQAGYYCYNEDGSPITQQKECPKGYYCPDLSSQFSQSQTTTAVYAPLPCPVGTYSDVTKLTSVTQCKPCAAGFRCNRKGQETYDYGQVDDNKCINGYICKAKTSVASQEECPLHKYCMAGIVYDCPYGTYGSTTGLAAASECVQCSPGQICYSPEERKDCPAGFYCTGGVSTFLGLSFGFITAKICPVGSYCPAKSNAPLLCPMGFYQSLTGQEACKDCPAGKYCNNNGTIVPQDCLEGMYCPVRTIYPKPCPIGTKSNALKTECEACPKGKYCWPEINFGLVTNERGSCSPGYVCNGGSYSPKPFTDTSGISASSNRFFTYNGPALRGYISSDGSTNQACKTGSYQPSLFGQVCTPCQAGSYCDREATGQLREDSFPCPQGKICEAGTSDVNKAPSCPSGLYSDRGAAHCMKCSDGFFKDSNQATCKSCPFGTFCNNTASLFPQACTDASQCSGGDSYDPACKQGSYFSTISRQCVLCDPGKYCVGGTIAGICQAGYLCTSGADSPTPDYLCPLNNFCYHGTTGATPCKTGTFRSIRGGIQDTDCSVCEAGQLCPRNQVPQDCPAGFYCPVEAGRALPCPAGTYGDKTKLVVISDCKNCPAGYLCSRTNITNFKNFSCPAGKYCLQRSLVATNCPAGTYRNITGGRFESDCWDCPAGYYCPLGTVKPIKCLGATNCPERSEYFSTCEGGHYCNDQNNQQQTLCPINHYCPRGSVNPIPCNGRLICDEGTELPVLCSAGSIIKQAQYGLINTCERCPQGTYSTVQDDICKPCTPGYLCYGKTNKQYPTIFRKHNGEICPKGHYCPESSYIPSPCPIGTYNPELGAISINQCMLCPTDTFNDKTGQSGCRPCGAYASSTEGSYSCKCVGNFRTFSHADSSCRCMSGYDFIDPIQLKSRGKESGTDNCSPLVFDRCDGLNQTRSASGQCVSITDCSKACNGGTGKRSQILGICTCDSKPNVDLVCGQNCRNNAPKMSLSNGTTINFVSRNSSTGLPTTVKIDLSKIGDLYGSLTCETGENCDIKTTEMSSQGGFFGKYGAPSLVDQTVRNLRTLHASDEDFRLNGFKRALSVLEDRYYFNDENDQRRVLAISEAEIGKASLKNPVMCLNRGDSMVFTIRNTQHYPVYLKDSVMNSNPSFDYGQFLILSDQMKTKQANNITSPSLFAFTFTVQGSYVFVDASDSEQLMIVRVTGAGESCPDPERYIQPLSGDALASSGVVQKSDIIIKPDVPLLVGMGSILVIAVLTVMIGVGYCLHKGWSLPKAILSGYRNLYLKTDVDHVSEETFRKNNDFSKFKSFLEMNPEKEDKDPEGEKLVGEEDDLDDINLNIHLDVLNAGQEYLKIFGDKKLIRSQEKNSRKHEVLQMISEIEQLINTIGSDAMIHQMELLNEGDLDGAENDLIDPETGEPRRGAKVAKLVSEDERKRQEEQARLEEERRQKMIQQEFSDRDRILLDKAQKDAADQLNRIKKDLNKNILELNKPGQNNGAGSGVDTDNFAMAMYDNQNVKSRQNQLVRQIENDPNLSEAEKEALLRNHNQNLTNIDEMMDAEKRKQDNELEKAIRERADRRKKALESKYKKEINQDIKEGELRIKEDIEARKVDGNRTIDRDIDNRLEEAATTGDKGTYRRQVDELKKERVDKKKNLDDTLNKEQESRMLTLREQVMEKWTKDAMNTDQDLEAILTGQQPSVDDALSHLKSQKDIEEAKLREKLDKRRKRLKEDLKEEKEKFEKDLQTKDPLIEEELEKKRNAALLQHLNNQSIQDIGVATGSHAQLPPAGPSALSQQQIQDQQQQLFQKVLSSIDTNLNTSQLLDSLREQGADPDMIERLRLDQEEEQRRKLDQRRELLKQRKALKKQQELEMKKLNEQLDIMQQEDDEKAKIGKEYLKEMFIQAENMHKVSNANLIELDDKAHQQERLVVFNEYASDEMLKRLSNLLMKQFVERESALKLLVQKYMDARLIEKTNIKTHFKQEHESLQKLFTAGLLDPEQLKHAQKSLKLKEENMLREVDLQLEKAHKEEEIKVRGDMDKRHAEEQVELKRKEMDEQIRIRKELELHQGANAQKEEELDRLNLRAFEEAKKREQERKQRSLQLHKQEVMRQLEGELRNKYTDYEELLRRKREEEAVLADQNLSIRKRLQERKQKIKEQLPQFSQEELRSMMERHELHLQTYESVYEEERRRQHLVMLKRIQQKKIKQDKINAIRAKADVQDVDNIKAQLVGNAELIDDMDFRLLKIDEQQDNELVHRLREWTRTRQDLKVQIDSRLLADTLIDLDPQTLKKLIMKLDNLEKGLRELRKIEQFKQKITKKQSVAVISGDQLNNNQSRSPLNNSPQPQNTKGVSLQMNNQNQNTSGVKNATSPQLQGGTNNPFSKVAPMKQSPTAAGAKAQNMIVSPKSGGAHVLSPRDKLKQAEEEAKHGMKRDEYTKFSKFAKKR